MKKIGIIAGCCLVVIIIGIFLINVNRKETDVTKERTRVGFILNGTCDDRSWGQSHYEAMEKTALELNLEVFYHESVPGGEEAVALMEELIDKGCEIIICNSLQYGDAILEVAQAHPEIYFFHAAGTESANNLSTYFGRIYQMRYLCGVVAGLQTQTNQIGYVAAFPYSEVNRGINAFTLGVRSVNPDAVVYVQWCNAWADEAMAADATNTLLDAHDIDVLTLHCDVLTPIDIASERGIWTIGYNMDNNEQYPDSMLTASVWRWENFYTEHILECLQGKFIGKEYWEGVETGIVALAPLSRQVKDGVEEKVQIERERLQSGTFDVFYGPIVDQDGVLRVADGENMSDQTLLNEFDWYVEGVVINGEDS